MAWSIAGCSGLFEGSYLGGLAFSREELWLRAVIRAAF
jgi:hypothetical protein